MRQMQQDPSGAWISADGQWRWNGQTWVPNSAVAQPVPGIFGFGDVISIPTRDPRWFAKCGLEGLIGLIPIYGYFEVAGWSLTYLDNLRAGHAVLPEAGFGYAQRGARLAVVSLIYGLVGALLFYAVFFGLFFAMVGTTPPRTTGACTDCSTSSSGPFPALFFGGFFGLQALVFLVYAALHFVVLPIALRAERYGIAAGLNLIAAVRMVLADLKLAAAAAFLVFLTFFVEGLGFYACIVGIVFSYGYAAAMFGAALRWYEQRQPEPA